jgi:hypothetical protein
MTIGLSVALAVCCAPAPERERVAIPGTALSIELVRIPASTDGSAPALLVGVTEIPWEVYDCFVYGFDEAPGSAGEGGAARPVDAARGDSSRGTSQSATADAITRPTKPYISIDRGFGHAGWPAISMSFKGATEFCAWLTAKTGRPFRLPTVAEWTRLCAAAENGAVPLEERAWIAANAGGTTRKVGSAKADSLLLHDLCGNVAEWCITEEGKGVVLGGSYRDAAEAVGCAALQRDTPSWNRSDPQFPKSVWWLADAPHVGMRIVCDLPGGDQGADAASKAEGAGTSSGAPGTPVSQRNP